MKSREFVYWLQGFFEIANPSEITYEQTIMIKKHLALVFKHEIDPSMGPKAHQDELNAIHNDSPILNVDMLPTHLQPTQPGEQPIFRC